MSHCLTKDAPHGLKPAGEAFDKAMQQAFKTHDAASLTSLDTHMVQDAEECSYRSSLILMGILDGMSYTYTQHAYEHPFGVGYLTAQCVLS
jgi:aromatic ring-opening dioxygenase LigB subunit